MKLLKMKEVVEKTGLRQRQKIYAMIKGWQIPSTL